METLLETGHSMEISRDDDLAKMARLTSEMFDDAVATTKARLGEPPATLRIER